MRVNVYAEEMTGRVEVIGKEIDGNVYTGVRFHLALPATVNGQQYQGPFMHKPGDDDSSAVTFWGKRDLRQTLQSALELLDRQPANSAASDGVRPPRIGHIWDGQGGTYVGIARGRDLGADYHLIMVDSEEKAIAWKDAMAWAKGLLIDSHRDFTLPTRSEQALLFANAKESFAQEWYWSSEQSAGDGESAWFQSFINGYQTSYRKTSELRARAVRRIPIE